MPESTENLLLKLKENWDSHVGSCNLMLNLFKLRPSYCIKIFGIYRSNRECFISMKKLMLVLRQYASQLEDEDLASQVEIRLHIIDLIEKDEFPLHKENNGGC